MKKFLIVSSCVAGLLVSSQVPQVLAQQGRTNGRSGRAMQPRRDSSKRQLNALWNGVWRIEGSATPLSGSQAKRIVAAVRPWSNKNSMTDAEAKTLVSTINSVLTSAQRGVVGDLNEGPGGGRGGGGRGMGGPGGPPPGGEMGGPPDGGRGGGPGGPPPGGGMSDSAMKMMATMNPFYAPTGYSTFKSLPQRIQTNMMHRYQETRATLVTLSRKAG